MSTRGRPFDAPGAAAALVLAALGCGGQRDAAPAGPSLYRGGPAPVSRAAEASMLEIPAGWYIAGSTAAEREAAYVAYRETAGHDGARKNRWFEREQERSRRQLPRYLIDVTPVEADRLNSAVGGPRDLIPVGSKPRGVSPYGMLDAAGNVFQWTSTPWPHGKGRMTVAGSAWDDFAGVGRGASRHGRRAWIRHAIVGFRCAGEQRTAVSGQR